MFVSFPGEFAAGRFLFLMVEPCGPWPLFPRAKRLAPRPDAPLPHLASPLDETGRLSSMGRGEHGQNHQAADSMSERSGVSIWDARWCSESDTCHRGSEIEAVLVVDAGLPYIRGFVVLLGPERGMLEVESRKPSCLSQGA